MARLVAAFDFLSRVFGGVCSAIIFVMITHVTLDVLSRYLLNHPLAGTAEVVANYYMVAIVFLPIAALELRDRHFSADVFPDLASSRTRRGLAILACLLSAGITAILAWRSWLIAVEKTADAEFLQAAQSLLPIWPARWFLVVGFAMMFVASCIRLIALLTNYVIPNESDANRNPGPGAEKLS